MNATVEFPDIDSWSAKGFAQDHFGAADLGHKKRNAALLRTAEQLFRHSGGTLPNKMGDSTAYKSMDRLMNRPQVTHASVLQPHLERTQQKMAAHSGPLLIVHDTTTLDYSGLKTVELGPIGEGHGRGYLCHNSLVVDPSNRETLGLAYQILHCRAEVPAGESVKQRRERESRESRLWSNAVQALGTPPEGQQVIDVCDRGADIYEFLAQEKTLGRACLVRAWHNRNIRIGHGDEGDSAQLFDHMRSLPSMGSRSKKIFESNKEKERTVKLSISYAAVTLLPPHVRKGDYDNRPIVAWCIRIWEAEPPQRVKPLEWLLVTYMPVEKASRAWTLSSYYECRFVIEEYHKAQKTGCQIEDLQFETAQALQPMIALLSVVATVLLNLRQACRGSNADTRPATDMVAPIYEEVLRADRYKEHRAPMTIKEFTMALARLGGHMNRRSDGNPGWLTLWRGWTKLQLLVTGAEAYRRCHKNAG